MNKIAVKIRLMANGKKLKIDLEYSYMRELSLYYLFDISLEPPTHRCLFDLAQSPFSIYSLSLGLLSKIIHGNCLMKQLSGGKIIIETNKRLSKNLRRKDGE